ncbi:MAG TPA: hypothetical protein VFF39_15305, partial [Verrucomicrobiae bacterium]|nr:hypothetical protein [Verrucomicrobiae bacterium]
LFSEIRIDTDAKSKSTSDIDKGRNPQDPKRGVTYLDAPYTNFVANDLYNPRYLLSVDIFELGNALSRITGQPGGNDPNNEKDASDLIECYANNEKKP